MAVVNPERGWQVGKTLRECNSYMFDNQLACDIKFSIQSPDGAVVTVPTHKYVLMSRSPVFEAMLSGDFTESAGHVVISDIEPHVFKAMLRFLYTEETDITADNVLYLMTAAKKYILDGLEGKCVEFLATNTDIETCCKVFDQAVSQNSVHTSKCLAVIKKKTLEILESKSFLEMSQPSLTKLLECDDLSVVEEIQIMKACKKWAEHKLEEKGDHTDENIRTILGDALFQVRFCSTTVEGIIDNNLQDLLDGEKFKLLATCTMNKSSDDGIRVAATKELQHAGYNINPRSYIPSLTLRAERFPEINSTYKWKQEGTPDAISFKVNKPIQLCGISLYCSAQKTSHACDIIVYDGVSKTWTPKTSIIMDSDGENTKQDMMLKKPVRLEAGVDHAVKVTLRGADCHNGQDGRTTTEVEGVTFSFMRHGDSTNGTDVHSGQIPDILFKHDTKR